MTCNDIICIDKKPEHIKMFFGDYGGYAREDTITYPQIVQLAEASESNTWFKNEIDYIKDIVGWNAFSPVAQRMFKLNISYQNLMDSAVSNLFFKISEVASNPELQYLYSRIGVEEAIHARTYSNGLNIVFGAEAEAILDAVYIDDEIKNRLITETENAREFIRLCITEKRQDDEAKMSILKTLGSIYLLEGIKFPFSFFVTWNLNKAFNNGIQGFSRALKLIGWDELTVHTTTGSTVLNTLRKNKDDGFSHLFKEFDEYMRQLTIDIVDAELHWNEYLLEDGPVPGYNKDIGKHFIEYMADHRLKAIRLKPIYNRKKNDVIDWYNKYRDLNKTTTALQEGDATNYMKGKLVNDLYKFQLEPDVLKTLLAIEDDIRKYTILDDEFTTQFLALDEMEDVPDEFINEQQDKLLEQIQNNGKLLINSKNEKRELLK